MIAPRELPEPGEGSGGPLVVTGRLQQQAVLVYSVISSVLFIGTGR